MAQISTKMAQIFTFEEISSVGVEIFTFDEFRQFRRVTNFSVPGKYHAKLPANVL